MGHVKIWGAVVILLLLITAGIILLSNQENEPAFTNQEMSSLAATWEDNGIGGTELDIFEFEKLLYLSPLSSSTFDFAENRMRGTKFTIDTELFEIDYTDADDYKIPDPKYTEEKMTDDMVKAFEKSTMSKVLISEYKEKYRYTIYTAENLKTNYYLYVMDGQLWLSSYADNTADKSEITMYLWKLK